MIKIIEIKHRMEQGQTKPILCTGEDGHDYVVKGWSAGRKTLIAEWIAGRLGLELGLPIPGFQQMWMDKDWAAFSAHDDAQNLSLSTSFGSSWIENSIELLGSQIAKIPDGLRAKVLLFDWWICNPDRIWTGTGGNPNLLWVTPNEQLAVIDHNMAFDTGEMTGFWDHHIFRADRTTWNKSFRETANEELKRALEKVEKFWSEMPDEWLEEPCPLTIDQVMEVLWRFDHNPSTFWGGT